MPARTPPAADPAPSKWSLRAFVSEWWSALLLLAAVVYLFRSVYPSIDVTEAADTAPDFTLTDAEGESFRLSEHRGEVVVLNFWATWCPPCRAEIPGFIALQRELEDQGVRFVGVALDEEGFDVVQPYAESRGINYRVVVDDGRVARLYGGITTVPTTLLIDRHGRIRYRHEGLLLKGALGSALRELVNEPR